jgi:cell division protein FtsI/penicillin-binding protein 2
MSETKSKRRLIFLAVTVICVILVFGARLYSLQVVHGDEFRARAEAQYTESSGPQNERGTVSLMTKDGSRRTAAYQKTGYVLAANGQTVQNPAAAFKKLQGIDGLNLERQEFIDSTASSTDPYIEISERLSQSTGEEINDLGVRGVRAYEKRWRQYPLDSLASHVLGFVGFNEQTTYPTGLYGIEKYYNDVLSRDAGSFYTNFFARVFLQSSTSTNSRPRRQNGDVNLTIEPDVQAYLQKQLKETKDEWNAKEAMGVVIEPDTGAIKGMGVKPDFNPNQYQNVNSPSVFTNPLVQSRYEMGSIIKALTMSAGLDSQVVTPDTTYNDTGEVTLNEFTIENYDGLARGVVDMQAVLNQSLNTGAAFVADELGRNQMRSYFRSWFADKTGIDLPGEINNNIDNLSVDRDLEFATASFGQGIALTPVATLQALTSLANGGKMTRPRVTHSIDYRLGGRERIAPQSEGQVISQEASDTVSEMLINVVDEALAGGDQSKARHSIAAKTGTAQISNAEGEYYEDRFNHTFFGYFPAYEPEYLVFLMVREPQDVRYASETLTEPFMNITDFLINYYNIPPDR